MKSRESYRQVSWDTGAGWSNRAGKVAYESRRDYIIAVKGKIRLRVTLSTRSESAAFRRISLISSSGDLWCGVVHDGVNKRPVRGGLPWISDFTDSTSINQFSSPADLQTYKLSLRNALHRQTTVVIDKQLNHSHPLIPRTV